MHYKDTCSSSSCGQKSACGSQEDPPPQTTKHGQDVMIQKWTDDNIQFRKRHQALQTEPTHPAPRMTPASVN